MKPARHVHSKNDKTVTLNCRQCGVPVYNCGFIAKEVTCVRCTQKLLDSSIKYLERNVNE